MSVVYKLRQKELVFITYYLCQTCFYRSFKLELANTAENNDLSWYKNVIIIIVNNSFQGKSIICKKGGEWEFYYKILQRGRLKPQWERIFGSIKPFRGCRAGSLLWGQGHSPPPPFGDLITNKYCIFYVEAGSCVFYNRLTKGILIAVESD